MDIDLSAVPAILASAASSSAAYVAFASLLIWFAVLTLFRPTDGASLRIFSILLLTVFLGSGTYAVFVSATAFQEEASEVAAMEPSGRVSAPLRLVVRGGPADDIRVREAMVLAVRWGSLPAAVAEVAFVESVTDVTAATPAFDPERARELMAEADRPNGVPIQLRLANDATASVVQAVETLAVEWSAIGTTSIVREPSGTAPASTITVDVRSHP